MKKIWLYSMGIVCLLAAVAAAAPEKLSEQELGEALNEIEGKLGGLRRLQADFVQEKHLAMFDRPLQAKGRIYFQAPDAIRFELLEPFASILIVRGEKVAKYERMDEGWQRLKLGNPDALTMVMNQIAAWMQGKFRRQSKIFSIHAQGRPELSLVLTPKDARFRKVIQQIELSFTPKRDALRTVTIRQPDGDFTVLRFINEKRDHGLPESLFELGPAPQFPDPAE